MKFGRLAAARSNMPEQRSGLWGASDAYEMYMGRWSRKIAPAFLECVGMRPEADWLDIGCGTGVLSAAILEHCAPKTIVGVDPSEGFVEAARGAIQDARFEGRVGGAEALEVPDNAADCAVSGLVLNFVSDEAKAVAEMTRTVRPGGKVALYVWDYAGHMQIMRYFFDAAIEMDAGALAFDDGVQARVCRPGPLKMLFEDAGLEDVAVEAIDTPAAFADFEDYWTPFLGKTGSAPKYLSTLEPDAQAQLKARVRDRIPIGPDGEILLAIRAWAMQGITRKPD